MNKLKYTMLFTLLVAIVMATNAKTSREIENSVIDDECHAESIVTDSLITAKIKALFMKEPELSALKIHVATKGGVVVLSGEVDSEYEKNIAISLAANVKDVEVVYCNLNVNFA